MPLVKVSKPNVSLALCSAGRTQADNAKYNSIEAKATKAVGGTYIDTVAWACTDSLCPIVINSKLAYFGQWHFSESQKEPKRGFRSKTIPVAAMIGIVVSRGHCIVWSITNADIAINVKRVESAKRGS